MASQEEIETQQQLLSQHRRTLTIYLAQLAQLSSSYAPPGTINGAYEACNHIRQIKATLADWGVAVEMQAGEELCEHSDFQKFVSALQGRRDRKPTAQGAPTPSAKKQTPDMNTTRVAPSNPTPTITEPIKIIRIITDEITQPRNDGTRGSALYKVPLQLSRTPTADWSRLFIETWNHPPQFTTMHRSGIAYISGDRIILDGTTVDEVAQYHRDTLKVVVQRVNELVAEREQVEQQQKEIELKQRQQHEADVREAAERLKFD